MSHLIIISYKPYLFIINHADSDRGRTLPHLRQGRPARGREAQPGLPGDQLPGEPGLLLRVHRDGAQEARVSARLCSTKPLKFVINEARKQSGSSKSKMNIDILLDIVATERKNSF